MPRNFIVLCDARTGSYSLASRLNSCSDITCHGEIFKRKRVEVLQEFRKRFPVKKVVDRNNDPIAFILKLREHSPRDHFGFKFFPQHFGWAPDVADYIKDDGTAKVILYREPVEVYASSLRAKATGVYTNKNVQVPKEILETKVRFTNKSLQRFSARYNRFLTLANLIAGLPNTFVIHYDQINDVGAIQALLRFIGSEARAEDSQSAYHKQFKGKLEDAFENWDELQDRLRGRRLFAKAPPPTHAGA